MDNTLMPFIREFAKAPTVVASVIPSSRALARQMASPIPSTGQPVVVELGPGTGAFSRTIQERLDGRGRHIALDVNERFTALLTQRYAGLDAVTADARDVAAILADRGLGQADAIVSGLPWAAFRPERQRELLDAIVDSLSPQGAFTTFAYIHARRFIPARRLRRSLTDRFEEVVLGRTVWANLPPALVYHCRRPRPHQQHHRTADIPGHTASPIEPVPAMPATA
ncbi:methyltransferase domain-containing protein [Streptosporangium sp. NBC_01810]|uniref:class I SAM-dependent methyltransferase n=1 Tax=Streptosporangium sp. NBC_01810 TaxID=2975951 RepID=UPI002DD988B2|nr:methyltransferase domain-containing protein [Streptosporangium sp. NBC_01810]WSA28574.1 methyltransferase domain-containing protein [Streptosporangium sp. NBC_01810]